MGFNKRYFTHLPVKYTNVNANERWNCPHCSHLISILLHSNLFFFFFGSVMRVCMCVYQIIFVALICITCYAHWMIHTFMHFAPKREPINWEMRRTKTRKKTLTITKFSRWEWFRCDDDDFFFFILYVKYPILKQSASTFSADLPLLRAVVILNTIYLLCSQLISLVIPKF